MKRDVLEEIPKIVCVQEVLLALKQKRPVFIIAILGLSFSILFPTPLLGFLVLLLLWAAQKNEKRISDLKFKYGL